jgi:hypothetical protein
MIDDLIDKIVGLPEFFEMKSSLIRAQAPTVYDIRFNMMAMMLKFKLH